MTWTTELTQALPGKVLTDPDSTQAYARDQCLVAAAGMPAAVLRAASTQDVATALTVASRHGVTVVARGAGTGLAGGSNAIDGCLTIDLTGLRTLEIDPTARTARVGAGILNAELDARARTHGLFYAPDPGSRAISSIGGNLATNAGGMCCAKYGVTADHALVLTAVLITGEVITVGRPTRKDVAGLDVRRLLIGSEGTLAVITEAVVTLLPVPEHTATAALTFPDLTIAVTAVGEITRAITPSAVELMDATTVAAVNAMVHMGLDEVPTVLVQCDGPGAGVDIETVASIATAFGAIDALATDDESEGHALMEARRVALTALEQLGATLLDDVCVPVHQLPAMQAGIDAAALDHGVRVGTFGHAADGNLHPTIIYDAAAPDGLAKAQACFDEIVRVALSLGGTVSGEHGIGSLKTGYLPDQLGAAELALMGRIKAAFDPDGLLNPGRGY